MAFRVIRPAVQKASSRPKRNKYGSERVEVDGITFDSKREAARWFDLCILQRAGEIKDLRRQVTYPLHGQYAPLVADSGRRLSYKADFVYIEVSTGNEIIEDSKGCKTEGYKLKRAILRAMGLRIVEV